MSGSTADPSVERVRETVAARLNAVGQRLTANRQSLLDTLVAAPRPLTIPEILDDRPPREWSLDDPRGMIHIRDFVDVLAGPTADPGQVFTSAADFATPSACW